MTRTHPLAFPLVFAIAAVTMLGSVPVHAAETDPYYGWWVPPKDGTSALNAAITIRLDDALRDVNRRADRESLRCEDVALSATVRLESTAGWFMLGLTRSWSVPFSPSSSTEYVETFTALTVYRDAALFPFGHFVPVDPAVRVGDIVFGTDKIAHFFTNGARYYRRYQDLRRAGADEAAAEDAAIDIGIGEESGWLGKWASGIFSYADLQANYRGLRFYRSLCEGLSPGLQLEDGQWHMATFDLARHVDPCWDEGFETSAFSDSDTPIIASAVRGLCPRYQRPDAQRRRAAYERQGCGGRNIDKTRAMIRRGELPNPSPTAIDQICRAITTSPP